MLIKAKSLLFRDLLYLHEVLQHKQISAAALKNGIKPSNLSKIIKDLESLCGKTLFKRNSHGIVPTNKALKLAAAIQNVELSFDQLVNDIYQEKNSNNLKLYVPENLEFKNIHKFLKQNPMFNLTLCQNESDADVMVTYSLPENANDLIVVENNIGEKFSQTIWVGAINNEKALALAQFIISEMHSQ